MKNSVNRKRVLTADEIGEMGARGEDVTGFFHKGKMMPPLPREPREDLHRVNVDFTLELLAGLDHEAKRLNISRQAVIKTMVSDNLDRKTRVRARPEKKKKTG